jgi:hypothetical protein
MARVEEEAGMTVDQLEREQDKLLPVEDLTPYRGQWVALRDGHVIASALDPLELRDNDAVRDGDVLTPVPMQADGIYIL